MNYKLSIDYRRALENGEFPLCILVIDGEQKRRIRIGRSCTRGDWEKLVHNYRLTAELKVLQQFCKQKLDEFEQSLVPKPESRDVMDFMLAKELTLRAKGLPYVTLWGARSSLLKFNGPVLREESIDHAFLDRWQAFIGGRETTRGIYLRELRRVVNQLAVTPYPFLKYPMPVGTGRKLALDHQDILALWDAPMSIKTRYYVNHWFLLYLLNGMNVVDLCSLRWRDKDKSTITFARQKTIRSSKKHIVVPLHAKALQLIEVLSIPGGPDDYMFPHFVGVTNYRLKVNLLVKLINKYTRVAGQSVGITKKISTYFARHSYATALLREGAPLKYISDSLGHSSLLTTERYLGSFESTIGRHYASKLLDT